MTRQQYLEALNNNHQSVTVDWVNENFATEQRLGVDWVADYLATESRLRGDWIADNLATDEQCREYIAGENEHAAAFGEFEKYAVPTDSFALHAVAEKLAEYRNYE